MARRSKTSNAPLTGKDELRKAELHEMLVPAAFRVPWSVSECPVSMSFYAIRFVPVPADREYRQFGLFVRAPLPDESEAMEVDLRLQKGRIVKATLELLGTITFSKEEIEMAEMFQEMWLKIILHRSEFVADSVPLGRDVSPITSSSTFYLLLPVGRHSEYGELDVDWETIRRCLSSPVFGESLTSGSKAVAPASVALQLIDGPVGVDDILGSLVFAPHNGAFYFVSGISMQKKCKDHLLFPEQPLLNVKHLFSLRNLLLNSMEDTRGKLGVRDKEEHFLKLPPEFCSLKIVGFAKDIGSSLSLLPSMMHHLQNFLVATELKKLLSGLFLGASEISVNRVLEALTTGRCQECSSLERLEVLGDAFLKYTVGRHDFLLWESLDEGDLTIRRSNIVNNMHLYELAIENNLQVYIRDEQFNASCFFAFGHPCKNVCHEDAEVTLHFQPGSNNKEYSDVKCTKSHHWLHRKTIADVVEALIGAFLVDVGFKAAIAFLRWIGIEVEFKSSDVYRAIEHSKRNLSLINNVDIESLEHLLCYTFHHKGLLLEALVHPSYRKHSGGSYQRLEFLGDSALEYLITSYIYSVYPGLGPGELTDLKEIAVNNNSLARIAIGCCLHSHIIEDCSSLHEAVNKFESFIHTSDSEKDILEELACPKVLGDIVESCVGAILLDAGFNLDRVWEVVLTLLGPILCFSSLQINPIRELKELCQDCNFQRFSVEDTGEYLVEVRVNLKESHLAFTAVNPNSNSAARMAAQRALVELKDLGYKLKRKSLQDILRFTRKKEAKLIGFDETPVETDTMVCTQPIHETNGHPLSVPLQRSFSGLCLSTDIISLQSESPYKLPNVMPKLDDAIRKTGVEADETIDGSAEYNYPARGIYAEDTTGYGFAKLQLFRICAINHWSPPLFQYCEEDDPRYPNMFRVKIILKVEAVATTVLECYSEPRADKVAAQEHAAEGALWYLRHQGYLSPT